MAGGMQRERAAGSLAKMRGTTPHILRKRDNVKPRRKSCSAAISIMSPVGSFHFHILCARPMSANCYTGSYEKHKEQ